MTLMPMAIINRSPINAFRAIKLTVSQVPCGLAEPFLSRLASACRSCMVYDDRPRCSRWLVKRSAGRGIMIIKPISMHRLRPVRVPGEASWDGQRAVCRFCQASSALSVPSVNGHIARFNIMRPRIGQRQASRIGSDRFPRNPNPPALLAMAAPRGLRRHLSEQESPTRRSAEKYLQTK